MTDLTAERLAQSFHEAYERLAPDHGYETREASAKPWAEVPANNRALMTAVCAEVMLPVLTDHARLTAALAASEKIARDNGFELARQSPTVARARGWQRRAETAEAEVTRLTALITAPDSPVGNVDGCLCSWSTLTDGPEQVHEQCPHHGTGTPAALSPTVQAEPADQLCSDKNGFHDGHDWRPDQDDLVWCPGYPVPTKAAPVVAEATQAADDWPELDENYSPPCGDDNCRQMHCGRCNEHSSSMGHYTSVCRRLGGLNGPTVPHHMCCPGNCENAAPDAVPAAAADRPVA